MKQQGIKIIAQNKKAFHEYFILDNYECGVELFGTEVKSLRQGRVNLKDSYCSFEKGELFILGMHISPYEKGNIFNKDPLRSKKLLMHKSELRSLFGKVRQDGCTLIPTKLYFKNSLVKVEIGLAKGKKLYDKREDSAKRDASREMDRALKERNR